MIPIPADFLSRVALPMRSAIVGPRQQVLIRILQPLLIPTLERFDINTIDRIAYWAGQCCIESDQFATTVEYASGDAYEGAARLGNTEPGDGRRFKGRGLIQLTGRANYERASVALGVDFVGNPSLAAEPRYAVLTAGWFWQDKHLNALADLDEDTDPPKIERITRKVNGGLTAVVERDEATDRAFRALGVEVAG